MNETPRPHRPLRADEIDLWLHVTRGVVPFADRILPQRLAAPEPKPAAPPMAEPVPPRPVPKPRGTAPLTTLDRRARQKVARGTIAIDAAIDLHGMVQEVAHRALTSFLRRAQAEGGKVVLVVTGKGRSASVDPSGLQREAGVLRRMVPLWLGAEDLRPLILGFEEAAPGHGGSGALYVLLRRTRQR